MQSIRKKPYVLIIAVVLTGLIVALALREPALKQIAVEQKLDASTFSE